MSEFIVETIQGAVGPETVLERLLGRVYELGPHHEAANMDMLTLRPSGQVDVDQLAKALAEKNYGIIRAKGFATSFDGKNAHSGGRAPLADLCRTGRFFGWGCLSRDQRRVKSCKVGEAI